MAVNVVSGFSPKGRLEYGEQFLTTFQKHWPKSVRLGVYVEEIDEALHMRAQGQILSLWDVPGAREFIERHRNEPRANGREVKPTWKDGDRRRGYSFRFDAWKFSRQCLIPAAAARSLPDGEILVWLDADVVTFADVPEGFVEGLLGDADGCYLGRGKKHSEIGFWAVRISDGTRGFVEGLADVYRTDGVFLLGEWHSAFVWDRCRESAEAMGLTFRNLTPRGHDHVWHQSPLCLYTDHLKGSRKALGRSPERAHVRARR